MTIGAYAQGVALARQAIQLEPDLMDAYYSLAMNYVGLKQYPQAIAVYQTMTTRFKLKFDRQRFDRSVTETQWRKSHEAPTVRRGTLSALARLSTCTVSRECCRAAAYCRAAPG